MDPEAAQYVLEQGLNLTMCPVDIRKALLYIQGGNRQPDV